MYDTVFRKARSKITFIIFNKEKKSDKQEIAAQNNRIIKVELLAVLGMAVNQI